MRRFLAYLLCLTLAFQGGAYAYAVTASCADGQGCAATMHSGGHGSADCCNDAETTVKTGKTCKSGHACAHVVVFIASDKAPLNASDEHSREQPLLTPSMPAEWFADLWHPPSHG